MSKYCFILLFKFFRLFSTESVDKRLRYYVMWQNICSWLFSVVKVDTETFCININCTSVVFKDFSQTMAYSVKLLAEGPFQRFELVQIYPFAPLLHKYRTIWIVPQTNKCKFAPWNFPWHGSQFSRGHRRAKSTKMCNSSLGEGYSV